MLSSFVGFISRVISLVSFSFPFSICFFDVFMCAWLFVVLFRMRVFLASFSKFDCFKAKTWPCCLWRRKINCWTRFAGNTKKTHFLHIPVSWCKRHIVWKHIRVPWSFFRFHADTHARSHVLLETHAESLDVLRWSESKWKHILNTFALQSLFWTLYGNTTVFITCFEMKSRNTCAFLCFLS